MKTIILFTIIALTSMTSSKKLNIDTEQKISVTDENFFKQELQNSVMEFCEDMEIDPDSVYMPFRDI